MENSIFVFLFFFEPFPKFKNTADFGAMTISVQHPGRLFAPEIMLSTFQITGYSFCVARLLMSN